MKTENLDYRAGDLDLRGYYPYDEHKAGQRPGILVVHEAWGLGDHSRHTAERLAKLGFAALAVDMVGGGKHFDATQDGLQFTRSMRADLPALRARIRAAYDALASRPEVDRARIASIGFCFGGSTSLELARSGAPVRGVVSFHGGLQTTAPAEPGRITAKILSITGADDPFIPAAQVQAFVDEMSHARADAQVIVYTGVKHSFTNPHAGDRAIDGIEYHQLADQRSWKAMLSFFEEIFQ